MAADVTLDRRTGVDNKVFRTPTKTVSFLATDLQKTFTLDANGLLHTLILDLPLWADNSALTTLTIEDGEGYELFNSTGKACDSKYIITNTTTLVPLAGISTVKITLDKLPQSAGDVKVAIYFT